MKNSIERSTTFSTYFYIHFWFCTDIFDICTPTVHYVEIYSLEFHLIFTVFVIFCFDSETTEPPQLSKL